MNNGNNGLLNLINKNYDNLSKGHKLIADYILDNFEKVAFMTASKVAEKVGVSESTVVRFANALGYRGYPSLQKDLQELIRNQLTTVERIELSKSNSSKEDILKEVMKSDIENIKRALQELDIDVVNEVVNLMIEAKKIYVLGLRSSAVLSQYLGFYLNFMLENVCILPHGANDIFDLLINIDENDVLIGMSFPRYSTRTIEAVKYVESKGAKIVAITDSPRSPITKYAKYTLIAPSNMTSIVDSLVAPMSLINTIIFALSIKANEKITATFKELENIWDEYNIYKKK